MNMKNEPELQCTWLRLELWFIAWKLGAH
jgi:hypothetical protein